MEQTTLDLDEAHDLPQRLLALMAEVIVAVWQSEQENDHDER
jgi:hypothetical protein